MIFYSRPLHPKTFLSSDLRSYPVRTVRPVHDGGSTQSPILPLRPHDVTVSDDTGVGTGWTLRTVEGRDPLPGGVFPPSFGRFAERPRDVPSGRGVRPFGSSGPRVGSLSLYRTSPPLSGLTPSVHRGGLRGSTLDDRFPRSTPFHFVKTCSSLFFHPDTLTPPPPVGPSSDRKGGTVSVTVTVIPVAYSWSRTPGTTQRRRGSEVWGRTSKDSKETVGKEPRFGSFFSRPGSTTNPPAPSRSPSGVW